LNIFVRSRYIIIIVTRLTNMDDDIDDMMDIAEEDSDVLVV